MIYYLLVFQIFVSQVANAGPCEAQLKSVLSEAQAQVKSHLAKDSPCYNAAMIGRKNGLPGCFPGADLSVLIGILNPVMADAKVICDGACFQERKRTSCHELTSQSRLRDIGILGVSDILKYPLVTESNRSPQ